ncbi:hypothetical protein HU200_050060 [Digitaria exilis]|uniref:Uncharacterized protein n=1 Tax=Digitaria exilis TaxID=1010633 RepID=A0A835E7Z6_9POAL|nr:hypothetical protein HU200_050060 [Digitaria exilis]
MGNILQCLWRGRGDNHGGGIGLQAGCDELPPAPSGPHHDVASLIQDLHYFDSTSMVKCMTDDGKEILIILFFRYRSILDSYKNMSPSPRTREEAAKLIVAALSMIQRSDLEYRNNESTYHPETVLSPQGVLSFYNLPIPFPSPPSASSSSLPDGVQFVLNTLPVRYDLQLQKKS